MNDLLVWAEDRPAFRLNEAERQVDITRESLREKLYRLTKRGRLHRIERGLYTLHDDPIVYATYIEIPSFLSLWSGLRFYEATTQLPSRTQVIVAAARDDLGEVEFHQSHSLFAYGKRRYRGFEVFVADPERVLIDCLSRPSVSVADLDELLQLVDIETAAACADRFGSNAVKKRVGYLLETYRGVVVESLEVADRNYPRLDLALPDAGQNDPRWRLKVNTDVD